MRAKLFYEVSAVIFFLETLWKKCGKPPPPLFLSHALTNISDPSVVTVSYSSSTLTHAVFTRHKPPARKHTVVNHRAHTHRHTHTTTSHTKHLFSLAGLQTDSRKSRMARCVKSIRCARIQQRSSGRYQMSCFIAICCIHSAASSIHNPPPPPSHRLSFTTLMENCLS